jgi:hypothetical protein
MKTTNDFNHFKLVSEGGEFIANCRTKCRTSMHATRDCPSKKAKDNWEAANQRCSLVPGDDLFFKVDFGILEDLKDCIISDDLKQIFLDNGITIKDNATVSIEEEGDMWVINNIDKTYVLKKTDTEIVIYELKF